jgi:hypothetical protein
MWIAAAPKSFAAPAADDALRLWHEVGTIEAENMMNCAVLPERAAGGAGGAIGPRRDRLRGKTQT